MMSKAVSSVLILLVVGCGGSVEKPTSSSSTELLFAPGTSMVQVRKELNRTLPKERIYESSSKFVVDSPSLHGLTFRMIEYGFDSSADLRGVTLASEFTYNYDSLMLLFNTARDAMTEKFGNDTFTAIKTAGDDSMVLAGLRRVMGTYVVGWDKRDSDNRVIDGELIIRDAAVYLTYGFK